MAYLPFEALWQESFREPTPYIGYMGHRLAVSALTELHDPLIRVPDYLAAVLSRWELSDNTLVPPSGATTRSMRRYLDVMGNWLPESEAIWTCRLYLDAEGLRTARLVMGRAPRDIELHRIRERQRAAILEPTTRSRQR